jgi:multiple sugar transport system substrate-binding protein
VLGGAGLAVSSASTHPTEAAEFAAWASGADAQHDIVARTGGQPGNRSAWDDPECDAIAAGFYSGTRASIERAWVRPREDWWPGFQLAAGRLLTEGLLDQPPEDLTRRLRELQRRHST